MIMMMLMMMMMMMMMMIRMMVMMTDYQFNMLHAAKGLRFQQSHISL